ncbi:hypothetical protein DFP72DRAFT_883009 [Ephemerocybe angulata]|uniref:Uncharacterized protein n=1 Tax=Ephemerocybe angulata TaxID=980116 RepID=A0A8H6M8R0_9AGAR|nr:hypothetical protein DFP72DRAFT_883009 [Tulosesus angulatus]
MVLSWEGDPRCLATATVNRLLRPLRTRCSALSKMVSTQSQPSTYSSSRRTSALLDSSNHELPLTVYPPPDKYASKAHFSQGYKGSLELIRRIYAVRDAFRNVVARGGKPDRLPTLSSLCARVIGHNMYGWEEPPEEEEEDSESEAADFVDQMYEAVPMACRGWLLTSHALGIILNTCPHHLTLISTLLDETLDHRLDNEVAQLQEALLLVAFRPKPNGPPAICHQAHSKFLTEWLDRWITVGFSPSTFTVGLLRVLSKTLSSEIWTSKAMETFIRRLYHLDSTAQSILKPHTGTRDTLTDLSEALSQWFTFIIGRPVSLPVDSPQNPSLSAAFFELIQASRFILSPDTTASALTLRDGVISISLTWLVYNRSTAPPTYLQMVEAMLASFIPQPSSFHGLVQHIFSGGSLQAGRRRLQLYASEIGRNKLARLEASLWGSTLYVVENLEGDNHLSPHDKAELKTYRQQVMEFVDEAESQLFDGPSHDDTILVVPDPRETDVPLVPQSPWTKGNWRWEPLIGSWVRQQALTAGAATERKKRRLTFVTPVKQAAAELSNLSEDFWTHTPRPKFRSRGTPRAAEKIPALLSKKPNFTSLIANAGSQRTVLHPVSTNCGLSFEDTNTHVPDVPNDWCSSPAMERRDRSQDEDRVVSEAHHQPSDDVLDLLAHRSSSPAPPW